MLRIPEGFEPLAMIAVGYPGDPDSLPESLGERELAPRLRKRLRETAFGATWGASLPVEDGAD